MPNAKLQTVSNASELARAAAEHFIKQGHEAMRERGRFTVALSGGSTPKSLYQLLADPSAPFRDQLSWDCTHFFFTDERHVPPDHPDSNYRMAYEAMLSRVPVPKENVHRICSENPQVAEVAEAYEQTLCHFFGPGNGELPRLDLVLLGLGQDGHTASIFPDSEVVHEHNRLVAAPWVEKLNSYRFTMTLPVLNNGDLDVFLVSGEEKAETLRAVLRGEPNSERLPAQLVKPNPGRVLWLVDEPAARCLQY